MVRTPPPPRAPWSRRGPLFGPASPLPPLAAAAAAVPLTLVACARWVLVALLDLAGASRCKTAPLRTPDARFAGLPGWPYAPRYIFVPAAGTHYGRVRMAYIDEGGGSGGEQRADGTGDAAATTAGEGDENGGGGHGEGRGEGGDAGADGGSSDATRQRRRRAAAAARERDRPVVLCLHGEPTWG